LKILANKLGELRFSDNPTKSAEVLSEWFLQTCQSLDSIQKFRISSEIPLERIYANYLMDAVVDKYDSDCGHNHRINLQLLLDNRQAVGTNLLKFEISSDRFQVTESNKALAIGITVNNECKKQLKIDGSVATLSEYEKACDIAYSEILKSRLVFVCLSI
jgi:hypothetical protein